MTKRTPPYSPEVRERAVRMVFDHQGEDTSPYEAIRSIAAKIASRARRCATGCDGGGRDQGFAPGRRARSRA
jgi:hypothetical protein